MLIRKTALIFMVASLGCSSSPTVPWRIVNPEHGADLTPYEFTADGRGSSGLSNTFVVKQSGVDTAVYNEIVTADSHGDWDFSPDGGSNLEFGLYDCAVGSVTVNGAGEMVPHDYHAIRFNVVQGGGFFDDSGGPMTDGPDDDYNIFENEDGAEDPEIDDEVNEDDDYSYEDE